MPTVDILNTGNKKVGTIELNDAFAAPVNESLFYETVKMHLANRRAGTASTKTRAYVSGGGAKPWKQKGTGRARSGSNRSPLWRHGGTVFGPHPRDYSYSVPKKVLRGALISCLSLKIREGRLKILDAIALDKPKTAVVAEILKTINSKKGLIVIDGPDTNLETAGRNLKDFKVVNVGGLNVFDLLYYDDLIITKKAIEHLERNIL